MADAPTGEGQMSKSALKKLEKEKKKEELKKKKAEEAEARKAASAEPDVQEGENFGDSKLIQSAEPSTKTFFDIKDLNASLVGKEVLVRARLQNSRVKGNLGFLFLRQRFYSVQSVVSVNEEKKIPKAMLKFIGNIPNESIVDITGTLKESNVEKATQHDVELDLSSIFVVSRAQIGLPIQIEDAERPKPILSQQKKEVAAISKEIETVEASLANASEQEKVSLTEKLQELKKKKEAANKYVILAKPTRLDNRIIDLRTAANQAIFRVNAGICRLFREYLTQNYFTEIHTPKMIACASEGGAEVFQIKYFDRDAYLAQSPQLFKQMAICADLEKVFEIGPVFRAEKSFTHRHLTEFTGLDLEMAFKENYHEVLDVIEEMLLYVFNGLNKHYADEIKAVKKQFPFTDMLIPEFKKTPRLRFPEAVKMLRDAGEEIGDYDDLSTPLERKLGAIVREKYNTDFFMLDKYPWKIRPFYTMKDPHDPNYSNSYDIFMRGQEICSGAQRVHDYDLLCQWVGEKGVNVDSIRAYVDAFKYGAPPHAGGGIGLERVVMLFLDIGSVKRTSMFPRDPNRLNP